MSSHRSYYPNLVDLPSSPPTPEVGHSKLYRKTDGTWYYMGDDGVENILVSAAVQFGATQSAVASVTIPNYQNIPAQNIAINGAGALNINNLINGTMTDNILMMSKGFSNQLTTAISNVIIGQEVLLSSSVPTVNTSVLIGRRVLNQCSAASLSGAVIIGNQAGNGADNCSRAVYIGESAGANSDVNGNVGIGASAGQFSTGIFNTSIGESAYSAISTVKGASQNTSVGTFAMGAMISGGFNTAIGVQAMRNTTTMNNSVAVGRWAMQNATAGSDNTAVGHQAGNTAGTFSDCLFLGAGASFNTFDGRTEDNVAIIGGFSGQLDKFIYGKGYETNGPQFSILFRPSYRRPAVNGEGTDMIFEAGEVANAANNSGDFLFRVGDSANLTGGFSPYIDAFRISGQIGTAGHLQAFNGASCDGATWIDASDRRLKEEVEPEVRGLETVLALEPKKYKYRKVIEKKKKIGFIAQDVEKLLPEVVTEDGEFKGIHYAGMIPVLVNAIKELSMRVNELEDKLEENEIL